MANQFDYVKEFQLFMLDSDFTIDVVVKADREKVYAYLRQKSQKDGLVNTVTETVSVGRYKSRPAITEAPEGKLFAAYQCEPDFSAPAPRFVSLHKTLHGAQDALYPSDDGKGRYQFASSAHRDDVWIGPDGFGEIRLVDING